MPLIDERGRLFGRVNLIDGLVGVVVLLLIPLAYGAYVLFRIPDPTITSIEPSVITEGETIALKLSGQNFRPYLKASIGENRSPGFLVQSPTEGAIKLPTLAPGTYDVLLLDEALEIARMPAALKVVPRIPPAPPVPPPLPRVNLQLVGVFEGLEPQEARFIRAGTTFFDLSEGGAKSGELVAQVLAVKDTEPATQRMRVGVRTLLLPVVSGEVQVPAIVRVSCRVAGDECPLFGTVVAPNARITIPLSSALSRPIGNQGHRAAAESDRKIQFTVSEVRDAAAPVTFKSPRPVGTIRVRFLVPRGVEEVVNVGDVDVGDALSRLVADKAFVTAIDPERETISASVGRGGYGLQGQVLTAFTATVRVPLAQTTSGWRYKDARVKIGATFTFETSSYLIEGWIVEAQVPPDSDGFLR